MNNRGGQFETSLLALAASLLVVVAAWQRSARFSVPRRIQLHRMKGREAGTEQLEFRVFPAGDVRLQESCSCVELTAIRVRTVGGETVVRCVASIGEHSDNVEPGVWILVDGVRNKYMGLEAE